MWWRGRCRRGLRFSLEPTDSSPLTPPPHCVWSPSPSCRWGGLFLRILDRHDLQLALAAGELDPPHIPHRRPADRAADGGVPADPAVRAVGLVLAHEGHDPLIVLLVGQRPRRYEPDPR